MSSSLARALRNFLKMLAIIIIKVSERMNVLSPPAQASRIIIYVMLVDLVDCGINPDLVYHDYYFSCVYYVPSHSKELNTYIQYQ